MGIVRHIDAAISSLLTHSEVQKFAEQKIDLAKLQNSESQKALIAGSKALANASETELAEDIRADQQILTDSEADEASKKDSIHFIVARYVRATLNSWTRGRYCH